MKRTLLLLAVLMVMFSGVVGGPSTATAQNRTGSAFLDNLFSGGQRGRDRRAARAVVAEQRRENRLDQAALNYFQFDAGAVDGVMGRQSRTAISAYQRLLGLPVTGGFLQSDRQFLRASHDQLSNGDAAMAQSILANPAGVQGVLLVLYQQQTGATGQPIAQIADLPSMRSLCVNIGASDPLDLVKAQFCNLRLLAIEDGDRLIAASPQAVNAEAILEHCSVFADSMAAFTIGAARRPMPEIQSELQVWVSTTSMPVESLTRIAKTCLSTGFRNDDPNITFASTLTLTGLQDPAYVELSAYHLAFDLAGNTDNAYDLGAEWLESAARDFDTRRASLTNQDGNLRAGIVRVLARVLLSHD